MSQSITVKLVSKQNPKLQLNKTSAKLNDKSQFQLEKVLKFFGIPNAVWIDEDNDPMETLKADRNGWTTVSFEFIEEVKIYTDGVSKKSTTTTTTTPVSSNNSQEPKSTVNASPKNLHQSQKEQQQPTVKTTTTTTTGSGSSGFSLDDLHRLAELKNKGILTEEEFNAKKKQILGL